VSIATSVSEHGATPALVLETAGCFYAFDKSRRAA